MTEIIPGKISFLGGGREDARIPKSAGTFCAFCLLAGRGLRTGRRQSAWGWCGRPPRRHGADGREAGKECVDPDPVNLKRQQGGHLDRVRWVGIHGHRLWRGNALQRAGRGAFENWSTPIRSDSFRLCQVSRGGCALPWPTPSLGVALGLLWWGSHPAMARR